MREKFSFARKKRALQLLGPAFQYPKQKRRLGQLCPGRFQTRTRRNNIGMLKKIAVLTALY